MAQGAAFAVVTGASSGIGLELAQCAVEAGYDVLICSDTAEIERAAAILRGNGPKVETLVADLSTLEGVDALYAASRGRPVDALFANAGRGLGKGFLDQDFTDIREVIDLNVTGTVYLLHRFVRDMRARGEGRVLITGSIGGFIPGTFQAVYNGTKAFLDNFSYALRHELKGTGVTVTCLMPGPTDTDFFETADMLDTKVGAEAKDDAAMVARAGFKAMMDGDAEVITGLPNKFQAAMARVSTPGMLAERHRDLAEPGSASKVKSHQ